MARRTPRLNKRTGLFGKGRGRRKGTPTRAGNVLRGIGGFAKTLVGSTKAGKKRRARRKADSAEDKKIKQTAKGLKGEYRDLGSTRGDARRMAKANAPGYIEVEKQQRLSDNRAKRAKRDAERAALAKAKKTKSSVRDGSGLASAEESAKKAAEMKQSREASKRDDLNRDRRAKNRAAEEKAKGGFYEKIGSDGKIKTVITRGKGESDEAFKARSKKARAEYKPKAKHGGALAIMIAPVKTKNKKTVKAIKKAPGGAAMKKMPTYKKGGALKSVPSDAKGLSKLPTSVRNKMGYMKNGGKVTDPKKKQTPQEKLRAAKKRFPNKKISLSSDGKIMYGGPKGDSGGAKPFVGKRMVKMKKKATMKAGAKMKMYGAKMKKK